MIHSGFQHHGVYNLVADLGAIYISICQNFQRVLRLVRHVDVDGSPCHSIKRIIDVVIENPSFGRNPFLRHD